MAADWNWYASESGETYEVGPCATREQAIAGALYDELGLHDDHSACTFTVAEATQPHLQIGHIIDVRRSIEEAEDGGQWSEYIGEGGDGLVDNVTSDQWADLDQRLLAAADEWQAAHGIIIKACAFGDLRNEERITVSLAARAALTNT